MINFQSGRLARSKHFLNLQQILLYLQALSYRFVYIIPTEFLGIIPTLTARHQVLTTIESLTAACFLSISGLLTTYAAVIS